MQRFAHKNESSDPPHKARSPGVQHWEDKPTEHLALKASRVVLRASLVAQR